MRLRIVRTINDKWLPCAARKLDAQFARDRLGNFILDRKDVVEFAIVSSPTTPVIRFAHRLTAR